MAMSAAHRSKFAALHGDVSIWVKNYRVGRKTQTYKQNKKWCGVDWFRCYMYFFSQFTGVMKEIVDNESTPFELSVMCEYARALFRNE